MKKYLYASLLLIACLVICSTMTMAQNLMWWRTYGGAWQDGAFSVVSTQDGGLVITGFNSSLNANHVNDVFLLKTDASGNQVWMRTFGAALNDRGRCVRQTQDGGFIIAGMTEISPQIYSALLARTDSTGNILWQRTFNLGDDARGHSAWQTLDGGFILAGQAWLGSPFGSYDMYLVKTDAAGNLQWQRTYAYNNNAAPGADIALSVRQLGDRGYILGGVTQSSVWASYLVRTDSLGTPIWSRVYDTLSVNECNNVILTSDNGFLLVGGKVNSGYSDVLLIKTDAGGNPIWQRTYGGATSDEAYSVRQLPDGGFAIAGNTTSFGAGGYDMYVLRTNALGDTLWTRTFGGSNDDRGFSLERAQDGGIVVAGWVWSFNAPLGDACVIKLQDSPLGVTLEPTHPTRTELLQNYPNPFNPRTTIRFELSAAQHVTLKVYNLLGKEVATLLNGNLQPGEHEVQWDASGQASGTYFYQLKADGFIATKPMALVK
jgi:hypothetical protein